MRVGRWTWNENRAFSYARWHLLNEQLCNCHLQRDMYEGGWNLDALASKRLLTHVAQTVQHQPPELAARGPLETVRAEPGQDPYFVERGNHQD